MINGKNNIFGKRLRELRLETLNMNQREFAKLLGIPQPSISAYESGINKPTIEKDAPENDSNDYVIKATIYLSFK